MLFSYQSFLAGTFAVILSFLNFVGSVPSVAAEACNMSGKEIIYSITACIYGKCNDHGKNRIIFLGDKVLKYYNDDTGVIFYVGKTVDAWQDPMQAVGRRYLETQEMTRTRWLTTATWNGDEIILEENIGWVVNGMAGTTIASVTIKIDNCKACKITKYSAKVSTGGPSMTLGGQSCQLTAAIGVH